MDRLKEGEQEQREQRELEQRRQQQQMQEEVNEQQRLELKHERERQLARQRQREIDDQSNKNVTCSNRDRRFTTNMYIKFKFRPGSNVKNSYEILSSTCMTRGPDLTMSND